MRVRIPDDRDRSVRDRDRLGFRGGYGLVIDGVFDATATGGVIFSAATGIEANAIAQVQAQLRRRLARACSRAAACCQPMTRRRWDNGNMAAASPWTARCASGLLTTLGANMYQRW